MCSWSNRAAGVAGNTAARPIKLFWSFHIFHIWFIVHSSPLLWVKIDEKFDREKKWVIRDEWHIVCCVPLLNIVSIEKSKVDEKTYIILPRILLKKKELWIDENFSSKSWFIFKNLIIVRLDIFYSKKDAQCLEIDFSPSKRKEQLNTYSFAHLPV